MFRRILLILALSAVLAALAGCHNKSVTNPLADVGSKQPDKVLFDRAMDAMQHNRYDVARLTLQTLINTYPDSEYIARAKLAIGDSWYAEGGSAALAQAENEYKDFETFFPNLPEAAEAQLKVANIHYRQMEKPDRDSTHAIRAEEEYRQLIMQYPDSKLVPEAKERLREVQEVLAEREFRIGRFYYLRESWPAAIARLQSLVDTYPLYSGADEALFMLGSTHERQIDAIRAARLNEDAKGKLLKEYTDLAAGAYSRIVSRYPVTDRAEDAKKRLAALHRPVPTPTPEALAQNKKEEESRKELGHFGKMMMNMHRRPDTSLAVHVGEPTLVDPKQTSAPDVVKQSTASLISASGSSVINPSGVVSAETVKTGTPPPNQPVPRSESAPGTAPADAPSNTGIEEMKPNVGNEVTAQPVPSSDSKTPPPAPAQINEAAPDQSSQSTTASSPSSPSSTDSKDSSQSNDSKDTSTSKKKKKKGLGKLNPF
ncbi:MAG: outer membrane protein assembly factor BamD [Terriglobales bacterium]